MKNDYINIGSISSDIYAQHLGVMLHSLLKNCSATKKIRIFIVDVGISSINRNKIDTVVKKFGVNVNYLKPNKNLIDGVKIQKQFSIATYYKFCLFEQVPVDKILYIDSDIVVEKDVVDLYSKPLSNNFLFAVEDPDMNLEHKNEIGLNKPDPYFNAGFLLINIKKWREQKITQKAIKFIRENPTKIAFSDQDGLNAVLVNKWKKIDSSWNTLAKTFYPIYWSLSPSAKVSRSSLSQLIKKKLVIHYAGFLKPWNFIDIVPLKERYQYYVSQTPWKNTRYVDANIELVAKRLIEYIEYIWKKIIKDTS